MQRDGRRCKEKLTTKRVGSNSSGVAVDMSSAVNSGRSEVRTSDGSTGDGRETVVLVLVVSDGSVSGGDVGGVQVGGEVVRVGVGGVVGVRVVVFNGSVRGVVEGYTEEGYVESDSIAIEN